MTFDYRQNARVDLPTAISGTGIVAIAPPAATHRLRPAVEQLLSSGISCVEIPLTTPEALPAVAALATAFGTDVCLGAGSVLTAAQAGDAIGAGAQFLSAPSTVAEVVRAAAEAKVACLPGALTPSEIVVAWTSGAAALRLFPASLGGPQYLREVRLALPDIPLLPTGGVTIDDLSGYLFAGALAVGLGSHLFGDALSDGDLEELRGRAGRAVQAVRVAREGRPM